MNGRGSEAVSLARLDATVEAMETIGEGNAIAKDTVVVKAAPHGIAAMVETAEIMDSASGAGTESAIGRLVLAGGPIVYSAGKAMLEDTEAMVETMEATQTGEVRGSTSTETMQSARSSTVAGTTGLARLDALSGTCPWRMPTVGARH